MKRKLSSWWEENSQRAYVAKRFLVLPEYAEKFAPFTRFVVYYCGVGFTPQQVEPEQGGLTYLINGEKDPPNAVEDSPWTRRGEELAELVGGAIRQEEPEIIPILYVSMGFENETKRVELSSDEVPLTEDDNRTVRVVCGQFENIVHSVPAPKDVTVLDVVLNQGGVFTWKLLPNQQAFIYVVSGNVRIGEKGQLANCRADTLVWARGKNVYVSAQCAGGRFFLATLPDQQPAKQQEAYVQEVLPELDQVEN